MEETIAGSRADPGAPTLLNRYPVLARGWAGYAVSCDIDSVDAAGVLDIVERILVEHNQIGPLVGFKSAQVLGMQKRSGTSGSCRDHLHRCQPRLHHELHFPMSEVAGKAS